MSADGYMTGDAPCWYSNDHHWHGSSACSECGARLRCDLCGRFVREQDLDRHYGDEGDKGTCPGLPALDRTIAAIRELAEAGPRPRPPLSNRTLDE